MPGEEAFSFSPWVALIREAPGAWRGLIQGAILSAAVERREVLRAGQVADEVVGTLAMAAGDRGDGAGSAAPPPPAPPHPPPDTPDDRSWQCGQCTRSFTTARGLRAYMARRHGYRCEARRYVGGSTCQACLMDFAARPLAVVHVRDSKRCMAALRATFRPHARRRD